jgi:glycosyltransferase involved in cell wall biosynthesis
LAQTFHNYECLLIDDGSTDGSPAICDEYAAKDARFKTYHKPNGGLSDARNFGLAHAIGEYTIFFDPDDWVDNECLKEMYAKAVETNADMVMCDYFNEDIYRRQYSKQIPTSLNHEDLLKDVLIGKIFGYTWNKLLKRDLYSQYQLEYPKDIYGCEDQYTMCALLKHDIKIAYLPKAFYHYVYVSGSLSRYYDDKTLQNDLKVREMFTSLFENSELRDLAFRCKSAAIYTRAFVLGGKLYSSKEFKQNFAEYYPYVGSSGIYRLFYFMSRYGMYKVAFQGFELLFRFKQIIKKYSI